MKSVRLIRRPSPVRWLFWQGPRCSRLGCQLDALLASIRWSRSGRNKAGSEVSAKMFGLAHDLIKQIEQMPPLVSYELGVTDDVDEEHIGYLELDFLGRFSRHWERL